MVFWALKVLRLNPGWDSKRGGWESLCCCCTAADKKSCYVQKVSIKRQRICLLIRLQKTFPMLKKLWVSEKKKKKKKIFEHNGNEKGGLRHHSVHRRMVPLCQQAMWKTYRVRLNSLFFFFFFQNSDSHIRKLDEHLLVSLWERNSPDQYSFRVLWGVNELDTLKANNAWQPKLFCTLGSSYQAYHSAARPCASLQQGSGYFECFQIHEIGCEFTFFWATFSNVTPP